MKFLHTSDWHLGMTINTDMTYEEDQRFAIREIIRIAKEENVDGILIAGDVFDKSIVSQDAIILYDEIMTEICIKEDIPVYMIAGNHDGASRISQCNELLKKSGLYIAGSIKREPQVVNVGDVDIYMLPWISTDKVKTIFTEDADSITSMEDAYRVVLDRYRESFVDGHRNILISHAYIVDSQTSESDKAAEIGTATMVGADVFEGFDYVALGHLHAPQDVNERIRYSGTPIIYSFGKEETQTKSVTIIDTEDMSHKTVDLPYLHKRVTVKGTKDELLYGEYPDEVIDGYVKAVVTDSYLGIELISRLKEKFHNIIEFSGQSFSNGNESITMTLEEFEQACSNPVSIFESFCREILGLENPTDRMRNLFEEAINNYEEGADEQ